MTTGNGQEEQFKSQSLEKKIPGPKSLLQYLTQEKLDSLKKAMYMIEDAGMTVKPMKMIMLLDEVMRLRKLCHTNGINPDIIE